MFLRIKTYIITALIAITFSNCSTQTETEWLDLFNGSDLSNWQVKFTGQPLGVNYLNTFRVEDGLLTVSYENWDQFDGEFGHLFL